MLSASTFAHAWLCVTDGPTDITHLPCHTFFYIFRHCKEREEGGGGGTTHWVGTGVQIRPPLAVPRGLLLCWWFFNDPSLATASLCCHEWQADGKSWWVNLTYQKRVEKDLLSLHPSKVPFLLRHFRENLFFFVSCFKLKWRQQQILTQNITLGVLGC